MQLLDASGAAASKVRAQTSSSRSTAHGVPADASPAAAEDKARECVPAPIQVQVQMEETANHGAAAAMASDDAEDESWAPDQPPPPADAGTLGEGAELELSAAESVEQARKEGLTLIASSQRSASGFRRVFFESGKYVARYGGTKSRQVLGHFLTAEAAALTYARHQASLGKRASRDVGADEAHEKEMDGMGVGMEELGMKEEESGMEEADMGRSRRWQ